MQPASALAPQAAPGKQVTAPAAPSTAPEPAPQFPGATSSSAQSSATRGIVESDQTQGPFQLGNQTFTFVKHVLNITGKSSVDDSTVEWWELRDAQGKPVFHQQYGKPAFQNGTFDNTEDAGALELKASQGRGLLIQGGELPSAPNGGWWIQVFGLINGKLTAMGPPMSADGEFLEEATESYQPSAMFRGQQPQPVNRDVLKFRVWTGNVSIIYEVLIDWIQGTVRPAWMCYRMSTRGQISACRYKVQADPVRATELTFVRLFPEPDDGFTAKHVVVKPDSKIEYIEAETPVTWSADQNNINFAVPDSQKVWLHIKVDGQDGWITGEEDFEAVGLPQSG